MAQGRDTTREMSGNPLLEEKEMECSRPKVAALVAVLTLCAGCGGVLTETAADTSLAAAFLAAPSAAAQEQQPGLKYTHYKASDSSQLLQPGRMTLVESGTKPGFVFVDKGDNFSLGFVGSINVPRAGVYTFFTSSDDGSFLWIDGERVVNSGGFHAMLERSGRIQLDAGKHSIALYYYQRRSDAGLDVQWQGPGVEKQKIPASVLTHTRGTRVLEDITRYLAQKPIEDLKGAENLGRSMCVAVRNIGKDMASMANPPVRPLAELLSSESKDTRWAAAIVLAMIGPEAKDALPALEKTFRNEKEDIGVRVRAARAIAEIKGTDVFELYKAIGDVERKIVASSKDVYSSLQSDESWQKYLAGKTSEHWSPSLFHGISSNRDSEYARMLHYLATGKNLKAANQWLREKLASNKASTKLPWMFGSNSRHFPGRLEPDVEDALQEKIFSGIESAGGWAGDWGSAKCTAVLEKFLAKEGQG